MAPRGIGFDTGIEQFEDTLREAVFAFVPRLAASGAVSLRCLRLALQLHMAMDLCDYRTSIRSYAEQALQALLGTRHGDEPNLLPQAAQADSANNRGFELFTRLHDEIGFSASWQGVWEPLARIRPLAEPAVEELGNLRMAIVGTVGCEFSHTDRGRMLFSKLHDEVGCYNWLRRGLRESLHSLGRERGPASLGNSMAEMKGNGGFPDGLQGLVSVDKQLADNIRTKSTLHVMLRPPSGMQILAKTIPGKITTLDVKASDMIRFVKAMTQHKEGIAPDQQRLSFASKQMEDSHTIAEHSAMPRIGISETWNVEAPDVIDTG